MKTAQANVSDPVGFHLRAAGRIVKLTKTFESEVTIRYNGRSANAKSIMGLASLAAGLAHPERLVGLHFFNPVAVLPLVEVIRCEDTDQEAMEAGRELAALEGIIPAIETSHAFAVLKSRRFRPEDILVFNLSGRGDKDLQTYIDFFDL